MALLPTTSGLTAFTGEKAKAKPVTNSKTNVFNPGGSFNFGATPPVKPIATPGFFPSTIGAKATSPTQKVKEDPKVLPKGQEAPRASITDPLRTTQEQNQSALGSMGAPVPQNPPQPQNGPQGAPPVTYPGILQDLFQKTQQDSADVKTARQALQDSQTNQAGALAANAGNPIPLEFQQGRGQILQSQYGQQQTALSNALQSATTTQGQRLGTLQSLAGLSQPVSQFGVLTDPQTGKPIGGGSALDAAIRGGQIQGAQQGAQTAAATQGGIQSTQTQQIATYKSAQQQAQNVGQQLGDLIKTFGVNPSDVNAVNQAVQRIAANTSDPNYQALHNYVNSIANLYSQILTPTGGSGTDTTREIAASMLDATASGKSILQVMQQLDSEANARIAGVSTTGGSGNSFVGDSWK